tara:strand:+ start:968 stop:1318 length:351 start_codon:yes stop_codon:yes gene_type:complete
MKKTICFDLDNIICITKGQNYKLSKPIKKNINFINYLYQNNFYIKIFTARYMGRNNDNIRKAKEMGHKMTLNQLKKWNVNYHKLIMGKPSYDVYIDDKNLEFKKNWIKKLKKKLKC